MSRTKNTITILQGEQDARPLMLHCARMVLNQLSVIDDERERMSAAGTWRDDDCAIDFAMCHAFDCVSRWVADLPERKAFEAQWWNLSGVVTLAARAFPNKDTAYWRMLDGADRAMQFLPEVWQTVADGIPQRREQEAGHGTR